MLAFLWQEEPKTLSAWLDALGLSTDIHRAGVDTQLTIPSGKRPDIAIRSEGSCTLVESKLGSGFGPTQVSDYIDYLETQDGRRALVLLTQKAESVSERDARRARKKNVTLLSRRWQDMAGYLGDPGEDSLAGDFIQLLIREGLVKPQPLESQDWTAWNAGYNVLLRLEALLNELDPHIQRLLPGAKKTSGLTKRWIYRVWRSDDVEIGFGLGAAEWDTRPHTEPVVFAFVGNKALGEEGAMRAVGVDHASRETWTSHEGLAASCGLLYSWPALSKRASEVLKAGTFDGQVEEAETFVRTTVGFFRDRGYLPAALATN